MVGVYPGAHGTRVPGTMVHIPYHPRWQYTRVPVPPFSSKRLFPLGAIGVFSAKLSGKHVFSGLRSMFYCVPGHLPGIRVTDPGIPRSGTKQNGECFFTFWQTGGTRKTVTFRTFPDPEHTVIRELLKPAQPCFWPFSVLSRDVPETGLFRDS